jgi:hypothetical protein
MRPDDVWREQKVADREPAADGRPRGGASRRLRLAGGGLAAAVVVCTAVYLLFPTWFVADPRLPSPGRTSAAADPDTPRLAGFYLDGRNTPFATLAEAIHAAEGNASITVHGDGPFATRDIDLGEKGIRIVAAQGSRPVFVPGESSPAADGPFLQSSADLHLEGIEVRWPMRPTGVRPVSVIAASSVVSVRDAQLTLVGCRLTTTGRSSCIGSHAGSIIITDSHLQSPSGPCMAWDPDGGSLVATNCVFESDRIGLLLDGRTSGERRVAVELKLVQCTFSVPCGVRLSVRRPMQLMQFDVRGCAFDVGEVLKMVGTGRMNNRLSLLDRRQMISLILDWKESQNAYRTSVQYLTRASAGNDADGQTIVDSAAQWQQLWAVDEGASLETEFVPQAADSPFAEGPFAEVCVPQAQTPFAVGARLESVGPAAE